MHFSVQNEPIIQIFFCDFAPIYKKDEGRLIVVRGYCLGVGVRLLKTMGGRVYPVLSSTSLSNKLERVLYSV